VHAAEAAPTDFKLGRAPSAVAMSSDKRTRSRTTLIGNFRPMAPVFPPALLPGHRIQPIPSRTNSGAGNGLGVSTMSTLQDVADVATLRKALSLLKAQGQPLAQAMSLTSKRRQRCSVR